MTLAAGGDVDYNISFQICAVFSCLCIWKGDLLTRLSLSVTARNTGEVRRVANSLVNHGLEIQDALNQPGSKPGKIPNVTS